MRVLIVEDEVIIAMCLEHHVEDMGHQVCDCARDADEAYELAARHHPDVLLTDIRLANGTSGLDAARRVRDDFNIPSIFVSGNLEQIPPDAIEPLHPVDLLSKPVDVNLLRGALQKAETLSTH